MRAFFGELWFWLTLPWFFLLDAIDAAVCRLTGGAPVLQSVQVVKCKWKLFRGRKVVKQELVCPDGYMYIEYTFDDGSRVLLRS